MKELLENRFWEKVEKTEGCWLWIGPVHKSESYGKLSVDGKTKLAHRLSYELAYGLLPERMKVFHRCKNPLCVRPDHLIGTIPLTVSMGSASALLDEKVRYII